MFLLFASSSVYAQRDFKRHAGGGIWRHWFVEASIGSNAYFGDISTYDHDPVNKLKFESKFGYSATLGKWINDWGAASFTFSSGQFKGLKNASESQTDFFQYTVEGKVNLTQLYFDHDVQSNFYLYAKLGYGLIDFNASYSNINTGDTINIVGSHSGYNKRVTEWVIPIGFGGTYNIDKNFGIFFDATLNYVNSDKLDARYDGADDNKKDYYIYLSAGLKYTFSIQDQHGFYKRPVSRRKIRWVR